MHCIINSFQEFSGIFSVFRFRFSIFGSAFSADSHASFAKQQATLPGSRTWAASFTSAIKKPPTFAYIGFTLLASF
jgi:hypothetical protein